MLKLGLEKHLVLVKYHYSKVLEDNLSKIHKWVQSIMYIIVLFKIIPLI